MKCARCGHEIDPHAARCEWCARGAPERFSGPGPAPAGDPDAPVRCPMCGSTQVTAVRRGYDPGCGCLGVLLFSWIGLLLGFLNADRVDLVCNRCGARWEPGNAEHRQGPLTTCGCLLVILLILAVLAFFCR